MTKYSGKVWYPFSQMAIEPMPIKIVRGDKALIFDDEDNAYIDAISSWWVNLHGHANKKIAKAVSKQLSTLEHVIFSGFTHEPAENLAKKIIHHLPKGFSHLFYSDNGSTSVEVALKMAIQFYFNKKQKRNKIIALTGAYHGDTFGAMAVGERGIFNLPFQDMFFEVKFFDIHKGSIDEFEKLCGDDVAAFIFEPLVQGAGGMLMYKESTLDKLLKITKKYDIICIADEVMTGFGRTGKLFAIDYLQEKPDIICLSKGITGGTMALGATACTLRIFEAFFSTDKNKTFFHGHSYTANPLACTAAVVSMDILESDKCQKSIEKISFSHKNFKKKLAKLSQVENIRIRGTILAFDIKCSDAGYMSLFRDRLYAEFIEQGVLLRPLGNTVYIMPPYVITEKQLEKVYEVILNVVSTI